MVNRHVLISFSQINRGVSNLLVATVDTGLSQADFHRLTVTVLKTYFQKHEPNIIMYWDYHKLSNQTFRAEFVKELSGKNISKYCAKYSKQICPCSQKTY